MQNVHKLTFILVQSLNLNIKNGTRININAVVLLDVFCQTHLILIFDIHEFVLALLIIHIQL